MDTTEIVTQLKEAHTRLDQAITALEGLGQPAKRRGRPPKTSEPVQAARRGPRTMSAAARAKIAAAQRARWAKQKGGAALKRSVAQKRSSRKPMSPAMRKKLSAMMKARWAQRKKAA
jgi:hypothetical protein